MLEPRDRLLLFEALKPPEGFHFDQGIGTTYSLDLLALLTAPLAFTWFEQQGDEDQRAGVAHDEVELPVARPMVARDERVAQSQEMLQGQPLADAAEVMPGVFAHGRRR